MRQEQNSSVERYLQYVQTIPRLSREEEHELALSVRDHDDPVALDALVRANLRYVVAIAVKYRRYRVPVADLVAEGNVGLVVAVRKFDPDRGTRFVTYAAHWIRAFMLDHIIKSASVVGGGSGPLRSKIFFRLRREKAKLTNLGLEPSEVDEGLARTFGTTVEKVRVMAERLESHDVSLDAPLHEDGGTMLDALSSSGATQEDLLARAEEAARLSEQVKGAIRELDARERFIVESRLLADAPSELSLAEIGRRLGVSRERARQIEARAKEKIRRHLVSADESLRHAA